MKPSLIDLKPEMATRAKTTEMRVVWAAGFLDGEGYVGITRTLYKPLNRYNYHAVLHAGQNARFPLDELAELFGGNVCRKQDRETYQWRLDGKKTVAALQQLVPYLILKRRQAELVIEFHSLTQPKQRGEMSRFRQMPDGVHQKQAEYHAVLMELNGKYRHAERLNKKAPQSADGAIVRSQENINLESEAEMTSPTTIQ
jgi:hypothetical protein